MPPTLADYQYDARNAAFPIPIEHLVWVGIPIGLLVFVSREQSNTALMDLMMIYLQPIFTFVSLAFVLLEAKRAYGGRPRTGKYALLLGMRTVVEMQNLPRLSSSVMAVAQVFASNTGNCPGISINPDICGIGVRTSTYVLLGTTVLSLICGSFHTGESGTKELGIAGLINLLGLAINLAKIGPGLLSASDVFVATMIIDAQSTTLSMTLSSKDGLAARWYVWVVIFSQIIAWISITLVSTRFGKPSFYSTRCCIRASWFSVLSSCNEHSASFKWYWYTHTVDYLSAAWIAARYTSVFDKLEKEQRTESEPAAYGRLPATAFSRWVGYCFYPVILVMSVEWHLSALELSSVSGWREWGQSMSLVACVGGVVHWLYVQARHGIQHLKKRSALSSPNKRSESPERDRSMVEPDAIRLLGTWEALRGVDRRLLEPYFPKYTSYRPL